MPHPRAAWAPFKLALGRGLRVTNDASRIAKHNPGRAGRGPLLRSLRDGTQGKRDDNLKKEHSQEWLCQTRGRLRRRLFSRWVVGYGSRVTTH